MAKTLNPVDATYYRLLQDILANGYEKSDRTGTGTLSVFGRNVRFDCRDGKIPLLTTKKIYTKGVISELLWFLQGRTDLRWLLENDNTIWVGDAYKNYLNKWKPKEDFKSNTHNEYLNQELVNEKPLSRDLFILCIKTDDEFSKKWGNLGPIYGKQWRKWTKTKVKIAKDGIPMGYSVEFIDQLQNAINTLLTNPDSRRNLVTSWQPSEIEEMTLPPCHIGFQFYTRKLTETERLKIYQKNNPNYVPHDHIESEMDENNIPKREISLKWEQRSVDTPLGLPFNIASYGLLLHIIGKIVNMVPGDLIGDLGDTHIYLNQIDGIKEQLKRSSNCEVPTIKHLKSDEFYQALKTDLSKLSEINVDDFQIIDYNPHPIIKMPLSN